jgi:hypothetical protein
MANNCYNYAQFEGSKENIRKAAKEIKKAIVDECLWWETYKKVFGDKYDYSSEDVYKEFGSKWFECNVDYNSESMTLSGDSAWSPAIPFFQKLCETFDLSCNAEYEEPGCDFGGWWEFKNGAVTRDETVSFRMYSDLNDPGRLFDMIIEDIDDDMYESYEDFNSSMSSEELSRLNVSQKEIIRNKIKRKL